MPTNKVVLRTVEEFMSDYTPIYQPIYPLLLGGRSQQYADEVGQVNFNRVNAVGDIRAKHITPKDTEIRQIAINESKKSFAKYFLANQFIQSALQDQTSTEDVTAQVLDEHQKQMDELFLYGDGTSSANVINNALLYSQDPNYVARSSATIAAGSDSNLSAFHAAIQAVASDLDTVAGRKLIILYGDTATTKYDGIYSGLGVPFKRLLGEVLGPNFNVVKLPSQVKPSSGNGIVGVNLDQIKSHYTVLPALKDQGINDEKMYSWFNFMMGSCMVEVTAPSGIIHQPVTFS